MKMKKVWVNVYKTYIYPERFAFSYSYPTRTAALEGRKKKKSINYLATIQITIPLT